MKRSDDIFRRLNKQKPLVKSRNIQPLSDRDFPQRKRVSFEAPPDGTREPRGEMARQKKVSLETPFNKTRVRDEGATARGGYDDYVIPDNKKREREEPEPERKKALSGDSGPELFSGPTRTGKETAPRQAPETAGARAFAERLPESGTADGEPRRIADVFINKKKETSFRHEMKYYINYRDYVTLRGMLRAVMRYDRFGGEDGTYFVRSLYFDDIYESALLEKIAGYDSRRKYRIRAYNFKDDNIRFEKKYKYGQYIAKTDIRLSRSEYESIMTQDYDFLKYRDEELAKELYLELRNNMLRPKVIVDYFREAFVFPIEEVRVTFDKDLRAGLWKGDIFDKNAPVMPMYDSGLMVMEVKFYKFLPEFIRTALNGLNASDRCAISKYVICRKYE